MKKRAVVILLLEVIVFQTINHFAFGGNRFGLVLEIEKLISCVVIAAFCVVYLCRQARITMYSYSLMSNLGILIFLLGNIGHQLYQIFFRFQLAPTLAAVYQATLDSFSVHVYLMFPFVVILALMLVASNIVLIRHNGARLTNLLGIALGLLLVGGSIIGLNIYHWLDTLLGTATPLTAGVIYWVEATTCLLVAYFECMMIATIICTVRSERYRPPFDQDFMIILGCRVQNDGRPSPILQGRLECALAFARQQWQATARPLTYIPSGGQGTDEVISEADAMKNYLLAKRVTATQILTEDRSTTTRENMTFSKRLLDARQADGKVLFATTGYHVWRSGVLAHEAGLRAVGIGARSPWYFYNNALIREFAANLYVQRQQHCFNLAILTGSIAVMLLAGYQLGLLGS